MRSKILFNSIGTTNVARTAIDILTSTLKHTPSLIEIMKCSNQICVKDDEVVTGRPYLSMAFDVFRRDMDRIEQVIAANLNLRLNCRKCNENLSINVTRVFGEHLFIEVSTFETFDDKCRISKLSHFCTDANTVIGSTRWTPRKYCDL